MDTLQKCCNCCWTPRFIHCMQMLVASTSSICSSNRKPRLARRNRFLNRDMFQLLQYSAEGQVQLCSSKQITGLGWVVLNFETQK